MDLVSKKGKKFVRLKFSGAKQNVYYLDFPLLIQRTWHWRHVNKIIKMFLMLLHRTMCK